MPSLQKPLGGDELLVLLAQNAEGKTCSEFYKECIEGVYGLTQNSLQTKISTEKRQFKVKASTWSVDGEPMKGEEIINQGLVEKVDDIPKKYDVVEEFDISTVIPNFKDGGRGRSTVRSSVDDLLGKLTAIGS